MSTRSSRRGAPLVSATIGGLTEGIIDIVIGIIVTVLNSAEIIVLLKKGRKRKKPENLILSLSCADFFIGLVYIIFGASKIMIHYNPKSKSTARKVAKNTRLVFSFTIVVSVLHLLVIAVERFHAVTRPLKYRTFVTRKRITFIVISVWTFSLSVIALLRLLPTALKQSKAKIGVYQGWLIFITAGVMILVYGYLAYYLFNRFQTKSSTGNTDKRNTEISYVDQKRDTIFCICIVAAFIVCSFLAAVGWLLPNSVNPVTRDLVNVIGQSLLVTNSFINPILYFWKSHLSRKGTMPARPLEMIKWALETGTDSRPPNPQTLHLGVDAKAANSLSKTSTPVSTPFSSREIPLKN